MSNRAWMPLHITDYLADTGHLSAAEHGAYMLMIMHYWQNGSLPANERLIARIARMSGEQWDESRDVLAMLFGENWTHKRIDAELTKADDIIEKRRAAADARHGKSKPDAHAEQVQSNSSDTGASTYNLEPTSTLRSDVSAPAKPTPRHELEIVLDADRAGAVLDHRQRIRKPLTAHAAKLLAGKFAKCPDPNAAADAMIANGWQGFEPDWMSRNQPARGSPQNRPLSKTDAVETLRERLRNGQRADGSSVGPDGRNALLLSLPGRAG